MCFPLSDAFHGKNLEFLLQISFPFSHNSNIWPLRCFPAFPAASRNFHSSGAAHTHCRICTNTSATGSPNFHPKHPNTHSSEQPNTQKQPNTRTTHSPIHIFYVLFTLPACAAKTTTDSIRGGKALGKPCDVTGEMRAINESIREKWCYTKEKLVKGKQKYLNDTSAQLRKELAIWLLILERFAVSWSFRKMAERECGKEREGESGENRKRWGESERSQRHRDRKSINKLTGCWKSSLRRDHYSRRRGARKVVAAQKRVNARVRRSLRCVLHFVG